MGKRSSKIKPFGKGVLIRLHPKRPNRPPSMMSSPGEVYRPEADVVAVGEDVTLVEVGDVVISRYWHGIEAGNDRYIIDEDDIRGIVE